MGDKVLVAYATKYGATKEIAERMGEVLGQAGVQADVQPAERVKDLDPYKAVVLGSAVYAGSWRKEAVAFLEAHEKALAQRPAWIFSSGPTGNADPVAIMKGWRFPEAQRPIADRIKPREIVMFHGVLDIKRMSFAERTIIKGMKAPTGDFRDWTAITAWAQGIAAALTPS